MKRLSQLLILLLFVTSACAQIDIVSPWKGPFADLGRNLTWGVSGAGGMNNAFVINVPTPQTGACLFIRNLDLLWNHTFNLGVFITDDQRAIGYYATPGAVWTPINIVSNNINGTLLAPPATYNIDANSMAVFSVSPASGAKVAFVISDSTAIGGTADIFYTFGSPSPCSAFIPTGAQIFTDLRSVATPGTVNINWVGFAPGALYAGAPQAWRSCSFYLDATLTGAAGTLNTYLGAYDSFSLMQDDRVSFVQLAATGRQAAQISFDTNTVPHTASVNALVAGSLRPGVLSDTLRVSYVVAGVGCTYGVYLIAICHLCGCPGCELQ